MQGSPLLLQMLSTIDPSKPYGTELFNALARLTISVSLEAVCLRYHPVHRNIDVYMTKRLDTESAYAGQWHCPGSFFRPREEEKDVIKRLEEKEFEAKIVSAKFVGKVHWQDVRGPSISLVYLCKLQEDIMLPKGDWFPIFNLSADAVDCHRNRIIPMAVEEFKKYL